MPGVSVLGSDAQGLLLAAAAIEKRYLALPDRRSPLKARILSGLGVPFIVRHPPELRTLLRQHALTIAGYAERSEE